MNATMTQWIRIIGVFVLGGVVGGVVVQAKSWREPVIRVGVQPSAVPLTAVAEPVITRQLLLERWNKCHLKVFYELEAEAFGAGGRDFPLLNDEDLMGLFRDLKKTVEGSPNLQSHLCRMEGIHLARRHRDVESLRATKEALDWLFADDFRQSARRMHVFMDLADAEPDLKKRADIHRMALRFAHAKIWGGSDNARDDIRSFYEVCRSHESALAMLLPPDSDEHVLIFGGSVPGLRDEFGDLKRFRVDSFGVFGYEACSWCESWLKDFTTDEPEMYPEELKVHVRAVHDFLLKHGAIEPEKYPIQFRIE